MTRLDKQELETAVMQLPQWKLHDGELVRTVSLPDFKAAIAFVNRVAELAEAAGHHPDIDIRYNKVRLVLVTHDAGGITKNDVEMAIRLDQITSL